MILINSCFIVWMQCRNISGASEHGELESNSRWNIVALCFSSTLISVDVELDGEGLCQAMGFNQLETSLLGLEQSLFYFAPRVWVPILKCFHLPLKQDAFILCILS